MTSQATAMTNRILLRERRLRRGAHPLLGLCVRRRRSVADRPRHFAEQCAGSASAPASTRSMRRNRPDHARMVVSLVPKKGRRALEQAVATQDAAIAKEIEQAKGAGPRCLDQRRNCSPSAARACSSEDGRRETIAGFSSRSHVPPWRAARRMQANFLPITARRRPTQWIGSYSTPS